MCIVILRKCKKEIKEDGFGLSQKKKDGFGQKIIGRHKREKRNEIVRAGVKLYYKNTNSVKVSVRVFCKY